MKQAVIHANLAFEPALLQVVEAHTQHMLTDFYEDFLEVMENLLSIVDRARKSGVTPSFEGFTESDRLLKNLQVHKEPFINVTRQHLTVAAPLVNVADTTKYESHPWTENAEQKEHDN